MTAHDHYAKYSPDQPRDPSGRWTSGGAKPYDKLGPRQQRRRRAELQRTWPRNTDVVDTGEHDFGQLQPEPKPAEKPHSEFTQRQLDRAMAQHEKLDQEVDNLQRQLDENADAILQRYGYKPNRMTTSATSDKALERHRTLLMQQFQRAQARRDELAGKIRELEGAKGKTVDHLALELKALLDGERDAAIEARAIGAHAHYR